MKSATCPLMTAFHRHCISPDDKVLALQQAVREVRIQPGYEYPSTIYSEMRQPTVNRAENPTLTCELSLPALELV